MTSFHAVLPSREGNLVLQKHWIRKRVEGQGREWRRKYAILTKTIQYDKVDGVNSVVQVVAGPTSIAGCLNNELEASALAETRGTIQLANMVSDYV